MSIEMLPGSSSRKGGGICRPNLEVCRVAILLDEVESALQSYAKKKLVDRPRKGRWEVSFIDGQISDNKRLCSINRETCLSMKEFILRPELSILR